MNAVSLFPKQNSPEILIDLLSFLRNDAAVNVDVCTRAELFRSVQQLAVIYNLWDDFSSLA